MKEVEPTILPALVYEPENNPPSFWIPKVQERLLGFCKSNPGSCLADEVLRLYIKGEIREDRIARHLAGKVGFYCLIVGVFIDWLAWA